MEGRAGQGHCHVGRVWTDTRSDVVAPSHQAAHVGIGLTAGLSLALGPEAMARRGDPS